VQFDQWTRRAFITLFGGAAVYWPVVANAETRNRPLIAWLGGSTPELGARNLDALRKGLTDVGYIEGKNIDILYRWRRAICRGSQRSPPSWRLLT
jgi:putative ABC transport system substrate-binding protein